MPITRQSTTKTLALEEVIARLSQQAAVDGLVVVGSAAQEQLTPASDYDLVLILAAMPVPLHVGVTYIDGRFTDLLFHTVDQVEQILAATTPVDFWDWTGRLIDWLQTGNVVFDRHGKIGQAQAKVKSGVWLQTNNDQATYGAWQSINYNLQVVRRYLAADDPAYLAAADIRMMLFGPQDLFFTYFTVRGLPPDNEKKVIQYLQSHDPEYLWLFNRFLTEQDRHVKYQLYEELAALTLAPVGGLWPTGETILNLDHRL
ncbi:MAG: hypothetical protein DYG89_50400 [Caldilinea sp. CFX5]|nr:hypothetical protein [Caldilinea sp. CFX5]